MSKDFKVGDSDNAPSLHHGHGTFEIKFTPEPEPKLEWQWLVKNNDGTFTVSAFREFDLSMAGEVCNKGESIWYSRIEESKREVKP